MRKLLVANRGEIACRVLRSAKTLGLGTVAVYSEADVQSLHVKRADEAILIGPAKAKESYLDFERILGAAREAGAEAIHPGYGFLSENAGFAQRVLDSGLTWIGPTPAQIRDMGDKERARGIAESAGVPVLTGSQRFLVGEIDCIFEAGESVGYPLLVKASAGGGGIGMRLVEQPDQLEAVVKSTQAMAERSFGDGTIFLERYIPKARHIEIQVFGFGGGRVVHFYERECSIQRRFQKVIEEAPASNLPENVREKMAAAAVSLAESQSYEGAGTVEFILDAETSDFFFLEMNTRIQVEHPVTEMTTDVDLVALQIKFARGDDLSAFTQASINQVGHAIECRLYAENPTKMFLPSPGTLETLILPQSTDRVRVETGVIEGDVITPYYDPMLVKLICSSETRRESLSMMADSLAETKIEGIAHNVSFLEKIVRHRDFQNGDTFTGFIDEHRASLIG
ncbi:MAG TPA: acetyl-CoA carboxylase biotin carboxylase subunit [Gammaproteobacteria bacterium]|nr:acetyl-CoA carboxylase biotin carboxylase subunit [Gammaproteobacteria bacterium]|tara:strand:+ start:1469 stop:2830 length:1362 start_codon:yes stop_codon:yes gene_type:complete